MLDHGTGILPEIKYRQLSMYFGPPKSALPLSSAICVFTSYQSGTVCNPQKYLCLHNSLLPVERHAVIGPFPEARPDALTSSPLARLQLVRGTGTIYSLRDA